MTYDHICSQVNRLAISPSGFTFDPQTGRSFTLNNTGLSVLNLLREGLDLGGIVKQLAAEFEQPPERVEAELGSFLGSLGSVLGGQAS